MNTAAPTSWLEVIILPGLLVFFGLLWWLISLGSERSADRPTFWKWLALLPLLFALFVGLRSVWYIHNPDTGWLYERSMRIGGRLNRKVFISHYVALVLPLLALAGVYVTSRIERRRRLREQEEAY